MGSILDQPCSCRRLLPEVKWGIPPSSVCAGPELQGEPGVHVVPVSSENRNIWGRREWLTGSVQQEQSLWQFVLDREILSIMCWSREQMHIKSHKIQFKTAGDGHSCCTYMAFLSSCLWGSLLKKVKGRIFSSSRSGEGCCGGTLPRDSNMFPRVLPIWA